MGRPCGHFQAFIETKIVDSSYLLVKIGAGYYVEMSRDRARDYFQRKLHFVESQYKLVAEKVGRLFGLVFALPWRCLRWLRWHYPPRI